MSCWDYYSRTLKEILWDPDLAESPLRRAVERRILTHCPSVGSRVPEPHEVPADPAVIVVRRGSSAELGACPGTRVHRCCNYLTLNVYAGCSLGCTYCIMQAYLRNRTLEVLVPQEAVLDALVRSAREPRRVPLRIGTGEVGDSLLFDPLFCLSESIIERLAGEPGVRFEVKTKTSWVDHLPDTWQSHGSPGSIVVGFSLNPQDFVEREEGYAAPLAERLSAARRAVDRGYRLAFHFDPVVHGPRWRERYGDVITMLNQFRDAPVAWVSVGTMRYPRMLAPWVEERPYGLGEFVASRDGKMRYLQPVRIAMYRFMQQELNSALPGAPVYLCMESSEVWQRAMIPSRELRTIMHPVAVPAVDMDGGSTAGGGMDARRAAGGRTAGGSTALSGEQV